ncbi:pyridine nucleotide-disulfide oxidoreductase domain-containing protein 2-like [Patiria miniata]|uniref:Pyridine nucleotide-disulfide oxidoreductase domain-containing protein 2 n=1 Tax=Patiria miniata TaxID=46514 RepID=A0A914B5K3_PATMI|nr:pyridine nucleotide-disulfide oxidoreductase domain-containing protein 2-like [Patiria miniata]XP_038071096.1 pyridine nucleotide-disulfide oxidoreductase domain-containing protein 2-like [Patiria miniata]
MFRLPVTIKSAVQRCLCHPLIGRSSGHVTARLLSTSGVHLRAEEKDPLTQEYDAVIIGAGHNGLTAAAYLQKAGLKTLVLERRHVIGGAAVTEEIVPGFKFSRCSYVLSLLRPDIHKDLELQKHGLKVYFRPGSAYAPLREETGQSGRPRSLLLSNDAEDTYNQIAQFSEKDAKNYFIYTKLIEEIGEAIGPLLDSSPVDLSVLGKGSIKERLDSWPAVKTLLKTGSQLGKNLPTFYELMTAPMAKILDRWFESEPLKAILATDCTTGAMVSSQTPGSGYVLLHHVMGEIEGVKHAWAFAEGGMGAVSRSIANAAEAHGATILTEKPVSTVLLDSDQRACGVVLEDGTEVRSKMVLSNATARITYLNLTPREALPKEFIEEVQAIDYTSPVTKINVAVDRLPNFAANPNLSSQEPSAHHTATIHLNCESMDLINDSYEPCTRGEIYHRPMIEMTIPSSMDRTIAPEGCHVVTLFTQYTPYHLANGEQWDEKKKNEYADLVFDNVEDYCPGFKSSVVGRDILPPPDLERIFGLTGGNIFHGAMSLDQLYFARPVPSCASYRSPIQGLYLCGSGAHPGGGVTGAPGRNAAQVASKDLKKRAVRN